MNYKFYASQSDFEEIFRFIFNELGLFVFQSYSEPGQTLKEFRKVEEVIIEIAENPKSQFVLWKKEFGFDYTISRLELNPKYCKGHTFRYRTDGWGLIHFQVNEITKMNLEASSLSHNSEKRAMAWESTKPELGKVEKLNWQEINSTSRKIKNYISKKLSIGKSEGTDVLVNAKDLVGVPKN
ncbi:hypothetical protein ACFSC6_10955 [Rufibacter sediminis]|uniref:Uncharacterized protein n=1 Tax=Rufibacter sediminis TaxID=2762756 RepID=A0ABR6VQF0_9BACT|nr:hypothetical protein [Rufibacter sediminis]MBC3539160.1 hypothetical protein [Rufibacter sediminis]